MLLLPTLKVSLNIVPITFGIFAGSLCALKKFNITNSEPYVHSTKPRNIASKRYWKLFTTITITLRTFDTNRFISFRLVHIMAAPNLVQVRISRFLRADVHKKKKKKEKRKRKPINNVKDNSHTGETAHRGKRTDRIIGRKMKREKERERERESL